MEEFIRYAALTGVCSILLGTVLFLALGKRIPEPKNRLRVCLPALILSTALAWVIPPVVAIARGMTPLPGWSVWLLPILLVFVLPSFWRALLNRLPAVPVLHGEEEWAEGTAPLDNAKPGGRGAGREPRSVVSSVVAVGTVPDAPVLPVVGTVSDAPVLPVVGVEADVTVLPVVGMETDASVLPVVSMESGRPDGEVSEVEARELPEEGLSAPLDTSDLFEPIRLLEAEANEVEPVRPLEADANEVEPVRPLEADANEVEPVRPLEDGASKAEPVRPLARILADAWDAWELGWTEEAVDCFQTGLASNPTADLRSSILLDLCALLHEMGEHGRALDLLASECVTGVDSRLVLLLRRELTRLAPVMAD